jgi:hypothetical protein
MAPRIKSNFRFGGPLAESDPLLEEAYYDNGDYAALEQFADHHRFLIGRTGSGKSAALRHLTQNHPGKIIRLAPEDLSLPYVTNLDILRRMSDLNVHLEPFFNALWKHVFVVEILRHRYSISTPEKQQNIFNMLLERFKQDEGKRVALAYLEEFGGSFWCDADVRV